MHLKISIEVTKPPHRQSSSLNGMDFFTCLYTSQGSHISLAKRVLCLYRLSYINRRWVFSPLKKDTGTTNLVVRWVFLVILNQKFCDLNF